MSKITNSERARLKNMLGKCLNKDGKLNGDKIEVFIEYVINLGWDLCEENMECELQALEGRRCEREKKEEEESS